MPTPSVAPDAPSTITTTPTPPLPPPPAIMDKVSDVYQKTAGAMSAVGEKTSSLFGGIGAKFGQLKETPTFKSFEERVGGVYSAARTRMGGSGSNSTQDFEEALKEAEGEKAALEAANGGTVQSTTPGTDVSQPAAS
ncbi:hypothetical protein OTU49_003720 [Cherax quadricarinatus]|uniref:Uncharacterized protein n=1 Tax=Cherax quadricarinatus TaxID=27406 RepID=A0AAW0YT52_CHEQU